MHCARSALAMTLLALGVSGCAGEFSYFRDGVATSLGQPNPGLLPPTTNPVTETNQKLRNLPPPKSPVAVAVYGYGDQTGQMKPLAQGQNIQSLSRAVTQGATSILIKALQDAGCGRWFTVVERERLDSLLKERRIIADMRQRYLGEQVVDPQALPPLLFAGVLLEGGIIGYDSNTKTGGIGANYLGIGGDASYTEDVVTVYLRGTSVKTGQVLLSVVANKKILSYGLDGNAFRYVTFNRILQAEVGFTRNEPGSLAVEQAIEQAVLMFIVEGSARGLWSFQSKAFQSQIIEDYELSYLHVAQADAGQGGASANGQNGRTAVAQNGTWRANVVSAVAPAQTQGHAADANPAPPRSMLAGMVQQPLTADASPNSKIQGKGVVPQPNQPQGAPQMQMQPAPQIVVQPRTLEDEVPIAPR